MREKKAPWGFAFVTFFNLRPAQEAVCHISYIIYHIIYVYTGAKGLCVRDVFQPKACARGRSPAACHLQKGLRLCQNASQGVFFLRFEFFFFLIGSVSPAKPGPVWSLPTCLP